MSAALVTRGLGKRYERRWALSGCTLEVPAGHVVGLVGPNGAGKTTRLQLAVRLIEPSTGSISVLGEEVAATRTQLALTLAIAKRPELLVLDEPVASLDPLARREFLQGLMEFTAEHTVSVVLSSHLVADLERVCDYLILVAEGHVQLCGEVDELLATHRRLSGPRRDSARLPASQQVVEESHTERQSTLLVRTEEPIIDPAWTVEQVSLEDIVLAYMRPPTRPADNAELSRSSR